MQQTPTPPPTPAPQAPPGTPVAQPVPTIGLDLSGYSANQLRRMLQELRAQRQDLADRRQTIGASYERATGTNQAGIGKRLEALDNNIAQYEVEIARVGRTYATKAGGESTTLPPGPIPGNYMREDDAAGMAFGFSFGTMLLTFFLVRRFMRRKYGGLPQNRQQPNMIASDERLERIEQAVDTIAVEVERVSENQRFMTRLMTETQLGDTIKDVRKSAELAKSAAESSG